MCFLIEVNNPLKKTAAFGMRKKRVPWRSHAGPKRAELSDKMVAVISRRNYFSF